MSASVPALVDLVPLRPSRSRGCGAITRAFARTITATLVLFVILLAAVPVVPQSVDEWKGQYTYTAFLGRNAGGAAIVVSYKIEIASSNSSLGAVITAEGYQTDETIRCDTRTHGNQIDFLFNSYPDGSTTNQFGVKLYEKSDKLLSLTRINLGKQKKYQAVWGKFNTDVKKKVFFSRAR